MLFIIDELLLKEWIDKAEITDKKQILEFVKNRIKQNIGFEKKQKQTTLKNSLPQSSSQQQQSQQKQQIFIPKKIQHIQSQSQSESDDQKYLQKHQKQIIQQPQIKQQKSSSVQKLSDVSCSSQDILDRIDEQLNVKIYGNITSRRKNKLNLLQFKLQNVLLKMNKEIFFKELSVRLEIQMYDNKQLKSFLIKKIQKE